MRAAFLVLLLAVPADAHVEAGCIANVPVYREGRVAERICAADASRRGLTLIDLSPAFAPRVLRGSSYREELTALSADPAGDLELRGVFPSFAVHHARLADEPRHACHEMVDDTALAIYPEPIQRDALAPSTQRLDPRRTAAIQVVEAHLVCEGMLELGEADGHYTQRTRHAIGSYRRRHMVPGKDVDAALREVLLAGSRELDFRAALRALRERVVDATGVIEDGSARAQWGRVFGRLLDPAPLRDTAGHPPLANGAPDWVSPATQAAARALGWTAPPRAQAALAAVPPLVAVRLPARPAYHSPHMELRAEIARGEVNVPLSARRQPRLVRPALVLYARHGDRETALVRWPTTIGGWQREKQPDDEVSWKYKESRPGQYFWSEILAAPTWFPPASTPDDELAKRVGDRLVANQEMIGPGPRSAYGLVMIIHRRPDGVDTQTRTHGTTSFLSVLETDSHGCHRLFTHLAVRLGSFLLVHRPHLALGEVRGGFWRRVEVEGREVTIRRNSRGYRHLLTPPVPVTILP